MAHDVFADECVGLNLCPFAVIFVFDVFCNEKEKAVWLDDAVDFFDDLFNFSSFEEMDGETCIDCVERIMFERQVSHVALDFCYIWMIEA